MEISKDHVKLTLRNVLDPISGQDLVTANRVGNLTIDEQHIRCTLVFGQALSAEQKSGLNFACMEALQRRFPSHQVHIHLETQLQPGKSRHAPLPHIKNVVAVASGKGGVGKSTVSTNLALALQREGYAVGLIDADLYGPSIPTMLGLEGQRPQLQDLHGKPKIIPLQSHGLGVISIGFIVEPEQAVVLRGPRLAGIIKQFIEDCLWPQLDYLIVDLPPGTGDIQLTLVQTVPVTGALIVTTPQQVAVVDAVKAMNMFRLPSINVPILGVIENMSWFTPPELPDKKYHLFGSGGGERLAQLSESLLLGQLPMVEAVRIASDVGKPIVSDDGEPEMQLLWKEIALNLVQRVALRNSQLDPTEIVQVKT